MLLLQSLFPVDEPPGVHGNHLPQSPTVIRRPSPEKGTEMGGRVHFDMDGNRGTVKAPLHLLLPGPQLLRSVCPRNEVKRIGWGQELTTHCTRSMDCGDGKHCVVLSHPVRIPILVCVLRSCSSHVDSPASQGPPIWVSRHSLVFYLL